LAARRRRYSQARTPAPHDFWKRSNPDISHLRPRYSLAPGFSPVEKGKDAKRRFNGFPPRVKAAEAAPGSLRLQPPG
jgi:hypothetical protein